MSKLRYTSKFKLEAVKQDQSRLALGCPAALERSGWQKWRTSAPLRVRGCIVHGPLFTLNFSLTASRHGASYLHRRSSIFGKMTMLKFFSFVLLVLLTGCNLTTDRPIFDESDAAPVRLKAGYYKTGTDTAHILVRDGMSVTNIQTDLKATNDAIAVDLGDETYLLQYGEVGEAKRNYVLFRYSADAKTIYTAVYDCSKALEFYENFGISVTVGSDGFCNLNGVGKERMRMVQRAIARVLPADSWKPQYEYLSDAEGEERVSGKPKRRAKAVDAPSKQRK